MLLSLAAHEYDSSNTTQEINARGPAVSNVSDAFLSALSSQCVRQPEPNRLRFNCVYFADSRGGWDLPYAYITSDFQICTAFGVFVFNMENFLLEKVKVKWSLCLTN
jgi:hypothetical protein